MNIGILWDIENVTPPVGSNYTQALIDAVSTDDRLSYAMAFGDWNLNHIKRIAPELTANNFELIHTPHGKKKNSADMSLVARGVEMIFQYPHIDRYVLISGDGDFRPLLLTQKKQGKETWVICDISNNASDDLIEMADKALDYRSIIKEMEDYDVSDSGAIETGANDLTKERAFELFKETIGLMIKQGQTPASGGVKSRMKLLNDQFDEKKLGYDSWLKFVQDAKRATNITFQDGYFSLENDADNTMPEIFKELMTALSKHKGEWVQFVQIAGKMNFKNSGYKKFKDFVLDAEKRGYVKTKYAMNIWYLQKR